METIKENNTPIKVYGKSELAGLYGIDWHTLRRWLVKLPDFDYQSIKNKRLLPITVVSDIFEKLGTP